MNRSAIRRDRFMLKGPLSKKGYDWWWHNFTGYKKSTGEQKSFFIEYFVCNPGLGGNRPILGQLPENIEKKIYPSYVLIKVGCWGNKAKQIHNFYAIDDFQSNSERLDIKVGSCTLTETGMKGSCVVSDEESASHPEYMCESGSMSWDLKIDKQIAFNVGYGASSTFRFLNPFEMFWHAEGIKTEYSGVVFLDGEEYEVFPEKSFGYADKNWGTDFTSPWLWVSSCDLTSLLSGKRLSNSALEIGGGNPKVYGISLGRKLLGCLFYEGQMYEYNFSKFWKRSKVTFSFEETTDFNEWTIDAENRTSAMAISLKCPKSEMLLINYESPNGKKLHNRLWNGGTGFGELKLYKKNANRRELVDHIEIQKAGCEYGEYGM